MTSPDTTCMETVEGISPRAQQSRFKSGSGAIGEVNGNAGLPDAVGVEPSLPAPVWSTSIIAAPRGRHLKVTKTVNGKAQASTTIVREPVWLATHCGKVILSHWLWPIGQSVRSGRWVMLGLKEQPLAWRPFIKDEFACVMVGKDATWPKGKTPAYPAELVGVAA